MAEIKIAPLGGNTFRVEVAEGDSVSRHEVQITAETLERLGWSGSLEELLRRSFDFLLSREPKESILAVFELSEISRYFPQFDSVIVPDQ
jgi:hypothetical protein